MTPDDKDAPEATPPSHEQAAPKDEPPQRGQPDADAALSGAVQEQGAAALGVVGRRKGSDLFRE